MGHTVIIRSKKELSQCSLESEVDVGFDEVMLMYLGRVSDVVFETASMNISAVSLLLVVVAAVQVAESSSRHRCFSNINASCITTCSTNVSWQHVTPNSTQETFTRHTSNHSIAR